MKSEQLSEETFVLLAAHVCVQERRELSPSYRFAAARADHIGWPDASEIVYLDILGKPVLIVGSVRAATEILEKRSANTSDRTPSHLLPLIGNDIAFSVMRYGQWWRDHRRAFWQVLHPGQLSRYHDVERGLAHELLARLLESPQDSKQHLRFILSAISMKVLYGLDANRVENGELIGMAQEALRCTTDLATRTHPVDVVPFLRHLPGWVPGAGFQYALAKCKAAVMHLKEVPFAKAKAAYDKGQYQPCAIAALLARMQALGGQDNVGDTYQEDVIKNAGLAAFEGADTTFYSLLGLFLAVSQHPEVQAKAHAELDRVVGPDRLPDFGDSKELVYINALIKEALRWHVVLPLALPHRTVEDDVYNGYFIPAGTMILPNTWAMLHDPEVYDSPEEFRPERFIRNGRIHTTARDGSAFSFGYGRRVCPGRYYADDLLYITVASALHVFQFEPPLDDRGQPVKIELRQSHGLVSYPEDYRCTIKSRSAEAAKLVLNAQVAFEEGL
ncbi:hypothetical protein VTO73DRAFT_5356 [Trametes versicolor]